MACVTCCRDKPFVPFRFLLFSWSGKISALWLTIGRSEIFFLCYPSYFFDTLSKTCTTKIFTRTTLTRQALPTHQSSCYYDFLSPREETTATEYSLVTFTTFSFPDETRLSSSLIHIGNISLLSPGKSQTFHRKARDAEEFFFISNKMSSDRMCHNEPYEPSVEHLETKW